MSSCGPRATTVFDARQVSSQLGPDPPFSQATLLRNELGTEVVTNPAQMFGTFTFDVPFTYGQPLDFIGAASSNPDSLTGLPGEAVTALGGATLSWNGFTSVRLPDGTLLPGFTVASESGHDWGDSPIPTLRPWDEVVRDWQGLADAHRDQLDLFVWPFSIPKGGRPRIYVRSTDDGRGFWKCFLRPDDRRIIAGFKLDQHGRIDAEASQRTMKPARCSSRSSGHVMGVQDEDFHRGRSSFRTHRAGSNRGAAVSSES